jgi:hypothetical protein
MPHIVVLIIHVEEIQKIVQHNLHALKIPLYYVGMGDALLKEGNVYPPINVMLLIRLDVLMGYVQKLPQIARKKLIVHLSLLDVKMEVAEKN